MRTSALAAVFVLLLAACGSSTTTTPATPPNSGSTTVATTTTSTPSTTTTVPSTTTTSPMTATRCSNPEGFSISYPADWFTNDGTVTGECSMFSPEPFEVPDSTDARVAPITAKVDNIAFDDLAEPAPDEVNRSLTVIDGHRARRVEIVEDGEAFYPAGTRVTAYHIDMAAGEDDRSGTLIATTVDVGSFDYDINQQVLDRMVHSIEIEGTDLSEVIARYGSGDTPLVVTATVVDGAVCASMNTHETCLEAPTDRPMTSTSLGDRLFAVTTDEVFTVDVTGPGGTTSYLPVPVPGTSLKAFASSGELIDSLAAFAIDGTELAAP